MKGISHEGKSFVLIQTKGDRNCLFHSLVASDKVNMTDASILWTYTYGKIAEWASSATQANGTVDADIEFVCWLCDNHHSWHICLPIK